jgi:hypothetical protein
MRKLISWLLLKDYEAEKSVIMRSAISRFTRGSVAVQDDRFLTEVDMAKVVARGDKDAQKLRSLLSVS